VTRPSDEHLQMTGKLGMSQTLCKYVQNHPTHEHGAYPPHLNFVGMPEMWFADMDSANSGFAGETLLEQLKEDESQFAQPEGSFFLALEEEQVYVDTGG